MRKIWVIYKKCFILIYSKKLYIINQIEKIALSIINIIYVYYFSLIISNIFNYNTDVFWRNVFINVVLTLLRVLLSFHSAKLEIYIKKNTNVHIKDKIVKEIFTLPPFIESQYPKGKIINVVMSDTLSPINFVYIINSYILKLFTTVITGIIMIQISWKLSVCSVIIFPVVNLINVHFGKKIRTGKVHVAEKNDIYIEYLKQILSSSLDITVNGFQDTIIGEHTKKMEEIKDKDLHLDMLQTVVRNICGLIENLNMLFVILFGGTLVFSGMLSTAHFYSFCSYSNKFNSSVSGFSSFSMDIQQLLVSVNRLLDFMEDVMKANEIEKKKECIDFHLQELALDGVELKFDKKYLFNDVSLKLNKGQILLLSGNNGVGKTSLLKVLASIYIPAKGRVTYGNVDIKNCTFNSIVKNVTFIFQTPCIYNLTILENLQMGNYASRDEIINLCKYFDLHKDILELPDAYDTVIDRKIVLSSGQEKKLQIVRGLLADTPIILLDEPLTCLDKNAQALFEQYIEKNRNNKITVNISHNPFTCDDGKQAIIDNKSLFFK